MKKCLYCDTMLPDAANFCPVCAKSQLEKTVPVHPKASGRKKRFVVLGLLIVVGLMLAVIFYPRNKRLQDNATAELVYQTKEGTYHLVLRNSMADLFHWRTAQPVYERMLERGRSAAIPLQLYVYDEESGENSAEAFAKLYQSSELKIEAQNRTAELEVSSIGYNETFPNAALEADLFYEAQNTEAVAEWTIYMKNGDILTLHEQISLKIQPEKHYSYQSTPLSNMQELQALLDEVSREEDPETSINIELAPVVYEGELVCRNHYICLQGATENGQTTIQGSVEFQTQDPSSRISLNDLKLVGDRSMTGVKTNGFVTATNCSWEGYGTGFLADETGFAVIFDCTFKNCGVGLHFNSTFSNASANYYANNAFYDNETGILLEHVPNEGTFYMIDMTFEGNGTDIENLAGNPIEDTY